MSVGTLTGWIASGGCAVGALLMWRIGRDRYLPLVVFLAVWCLALALFLLAGESVFPLESRTVLLIGIGVSGVLLGFGVQQLARLGARNESVIFDSDRIRTWHSLLCIALTFFVVLQLYKVWPLLAEVGGLRGVLTGGEGLSFRRAYLMERLDEVQGSLSGGGLVLAVIGYALFLGLASVFTGSYLTLNGSVFRGLFPLAVIAVYAVFMLERAAFLYAAVLYLASLFYFSRIDTARRPPLASSARSWGSLLALGVIALVAILQPILSRRSGAGHGDVQAGPFAYIYSGISGLNGLVRLDPSLAGAFTGAFSPFPPKVLGDPSVLGGGYGAWTFQGLFGIASRFGLVSDSPPASLNFVSTGPDLVGSTSNVYTFVIYPIYDYGFSGLIIGGIALGVFVGASHRMVLARLSVFFLPLAALGIATLAMSFFSMTLVRDFRYAVMCVFAGLLLRALSRYVDRPGPRSAVQEVARMSEVRTKGSDS
ncbi:O-antigen polymerase [Gordonia sp. HS-NH1]|uniref:O-antigen polymerase n=1 Tax=Gordonia sp. HS-NH1 TaxID=1435068 RepID=UPI0009FE6DED|nr:O-antigen polymerase [Gordonia sp. HS-NH1]